jgi:signal transduction histidine kinase
MIDWPKWVAANPPLAVIQDGETADAGLATVTTIANAAAGIAMLVLAGLFMLIVVTREGDPRRWLALLLVGFIGGSGLCFALDAFAAQPPTGWLSTGARIVTALMAWGTLLLVIPAMPRLMVLRPQEVLQTEIEQRIEVERGLTEARAELERKVEERTRELQRSNADLEEFAYVASHDLQEPLRKITVFADMLGEDLGDGLTDTGRDCLARMQSAAQRMNALIEDMLHVSRAATKGEQTQRLPLDEILKGALQDVDAAIKEAGAEIEVAELSPVTAAPAEMGRVFINLLGNAVKYRRKDAALKVRVECRPVKDGMVEVAVADNGIGFEQEYAERIFKPFHRLHSRDEYPGSGIGLAVCRKIIERHGGHISAMGTPGEGATFRFTLPVVTT